MIDYTKPVQTVSGEPVEIITTKGRGDYPVIAYLGKDSRPFMWTANGMPPDWSYAHYALINTREKPKTIVRWLKAYAEGSVIMFESKEEADDDGFNDCIACKRVEFTEGVFDGDE